MPFRFEYLSLQCYRPQHRLLHEKFTIPAFHIAFLCLLLWFWPHNRPVHHVIEAPLGWTSDLFLGRRLNAIVLMVVLRCIFLLFGFGGLVFHTVTHECCFCCSIWCSLLQKRDNYFFQQPIIRARRWLVWSIMHYAHSTISLLLPVPDLTLFYLLSVSLHDCRIVHFLSYGDMPGWL